MMKRIIIATMALLCLFCNEGRTSARPANGEDSNTLVSTACVVNDHHAAVTTGLQEGVYYSKLTHYQTDQILETRGPVLSFLYDEHYQNSSQQDGTMFEASIYNWKQNELVTIQLEKEIGVNYYSLDLSQLCGLFEVSDEVYRLRVHTKDNGLIQLKFRYTAPPELKGDIVYAAEEWDCGSQKNTEIAYAGMISGGTAPYQITWYVSASKELTAADFPRDREQLAHQGKSRGITVFDPPGYYVLMLVTDACGQELEKTAYVQCEQRESVENTLFFQVLDRPVPVERPVPASPNIPKR